MTLGDPTPRRGEVWLSRLDKVRPLVVLTRDPMGRFLHAVIAAPITSTVRGVSTEVPVGPSDGVRIESVANLDNLQLVSRSRLIRRVGRATSSTMTAICEALAIAVDCE
jgi:mRNA interferase MazF